MRRTTRSGTTLDPRLPRGHEARHRRLRDRRRVGSTPSSSSARTGRRRTESRCGRRTPAAPSASLADWMGRLGIGD
ncbi:MAG: hypothetical protein MZW92_35145 [Comamonadaceae bacterium]|nr:hypothetical protein [Comamonadaceae bacterium]